MPRRKGWSYATGEKARNRVRCYERPDRPGTYVLQYSAPDAQGRPRQHRQSLGTCHRSDAKRKTDELAGKFATAPAAGPVKRATFGALCDRYLAEVSPRKSAGAQIHDRIAINLARTAFGERRDPRTLDRSDWDAFVRQRLAGTLAPPGRRNCETVNPGTVGHDLRKINAVLNWATMLLDAAGDPVLPRHPFRGMIVPRTDAPKRPRVTQDELDRMLAVADRIDPRCRLALVLADETGHRSSSIRQLRWGDVDLTAQTVLWRAEADKMRHQHPTPLSDAAVAALRAERAIRPAVGDAPLFPSELTPSQPCSRQVFVRWWPLLERLAGLPPSAHRGWHSLRRRFADQLRGVPPRDLADLGGWRSPRMAIEVYQGTDVEAQRVALTARQRVAER